jgi:hypothetical protein
MSSIITPAQLNSYMQKTLPAATASLISDGINQYIENITSRAWGESKTITERYNWGRTLWLRHQDVASITSIKVGWPGQPQTTLDSTGYFLNPLGRVTMFWQAMSRGSNGSPLYNDYIEVTYTYGTENVPDDLVQAGLALASRAYTKSTQSEQAAMTQRVGSYELRFQQTQPGAKPEPGTPDAVIASYATRRV